MHQNSPDAPRSWLRDRTGCSWALIATVILWAVALWIIFT